MREFFYYLVTFLRGKSPSETYNIKGASPLNKTGIRSLKIPRINSKITLLPAHLIFLQGQKNFTRLGIYQEPTPEKTVRKEISRHDVIFINQGTHYSGTALLGETTIHLSNVGMMLHGEDSTCNVSFSLPGFYLIEKQYSG